MNAPPRLFDTSLLRRRKQRRASAFADNAFLHARVAADLADRLEAIARRFPSVLALGGGGLFSAEVRKRPALRERLGQISEADWAGAEVSAEPDRLHFAEGGFDLIVSPLFLHWANDLPGALVLLRRALKPDGLMLATLFGGETLSELRLSLLEAEVELTGAAAMRVAPFASLQDIAHLTQRAGFALPAADRDTFAVRYRDPIKLIADLRAMGETAAFAEPARPLRRDVLARALVIYRERFAEPEGKVRATFEILTATGWAPHASQQRPLQPGSAKARLADALGAVDHKAGEAAPSPRRREET